MRRCADWGPGRDPTPAGRGRRTLSRSPRAGRRRGDHRRGDRLPPRSPRRSVRRGRRRDGVSRRRSGPRCRRDSRPEGRLRRARRSREGGARALGRPRGRHHRLDRQDLDEGHPGRALPRPGAHGRRRGELQQRARRTAHPLPARAGHGGLRPRAGDARPRPDRGALRDRPTGRRRDHERRPGAPRAGRLARERPPREERADRVVAAGRRRRRPGGAAGRTRRRRGPARREA